MVLKCGCFSYNRLPKWDSLFDHDSWSIWLGVCDRREGVIDNNYLNAYGTTGAFPHTFKHQIGHSGDPHSIRWFGSPHNLWRPCETMTEFNNWYIHCLKDRTQTCSNSPVSPSLYVWHKNPSLQLSMRIFEEDISSICLICKHHLLP